MSQIQSQILSFSNRLRETLGISETDYCSTKYRKAQWHTPNFIIDLNHRCFKEGWFDVFEICPRFDRRDTLIKIWNVKEHIPKNVPWHYRFFGTSTENLPPAYYRDIMLNEIKNTEQKIYWITIDGLQNFTNCLNSVEPIDEAITNRWEILDL